MANPTERHGVGARFEYPGPAAHTSDLGLVPLDTIPVAREPGSCSCQETLL